MFTLNIKAISVNEAYKGRRFATNKLKEFKQDVYYLLPKIKVPEGKLKVKYVFGFSSKGSDIDNAVKGIQDILAEKYQFNDNRIYKLEVEKIDVAKGKEYIEFQISAFE